MRNMMMLLGFFFILFCGQQVSAQKKYNPPMNQQVKEYFDNNWQRCNSKNASYYRIITYEKPNIPKGVVKDYYISDTLQNEFFASYIDYENDSKNILHGKSTWYNKEGEIKTITHFINGIANGLIQHFYNGKLEVSYNAIDGKIEGWEKIYDEDGRISEERNYVNNLWEGSIKTYFKNGHIQSSSTHNDDTKESIEINYHYNGKKAMEILYKNYNIKTKKYYDTTGEFIINGTFIEYNNDSTIKKKNYISEGKEYRHTRYDFYNGKLESETGYLNNELLHGTQKYYNENGNLHSETNYKNGETDSLQKYYRQNGKLEIEEYYVNNKKIWQKNYNEKGKLIEEIPYGKNGYSYQGIYKIYYSNGNIREEKNYNNGILEGIAKVYYQNGKIATLTHYENEEILGDILYYDTMGNNIKNGVVALYNEEGLLIDKITIENGKKNSNIEYKYSDSGILIREKKLVGDRLNGITKEYYDNGNIKIEFNYIDNDLNGITKTYYTDATLKCEYNYLNDLSIEEKLYYPNGKIARHIDKRSETPVTIYYDTLGKPISNGNFYLNDEQYIIEFTFKEGKMNGKAKNKNLETGEFIIFNYENNKLQGVYKQYSEDSTLIMESMYVNDKLHGTKKTYEYGKLYILENYKNNELDGIQKTYYDELDSEEYYKNGKKEGLQKSYYEGKIITEKYYKKGKILWKKNYYYEDNYDD